MLKPILIATTNPGKFKEFTAEFQDLPFNFLNLVAVGLSKVAASEPFATTWENALHKAKFYAQKTKLPTIAEDTGLFIKYLNGKPGVKTKQNAPTEADRIIKILKLLQGIPKNKRGAYFETSACLYNPHTEQFSIFKGSVHGRIAQKPMGHSRPGMEHDRIFYYPPAKKTFAQISLLQKNLVSHRGQVIKQVRSFLQHQYEAKQFIVPVALIARNRKVLLLQRRDPRPAFNNKWEFPGGGVDGGETVTACLRRETKEETGYTVRVLEQLPGIPSAIRRQENYQLFLIAFVCAIVSGSFATADSETASYRWCTLNESLRLPLLDLNKKIIQGNILLLKKYFD